MMSDLAWKYSANFSRVLSGAAGTEVGVFMHEFDNDYDAFNSGFHAKHVFRFQSGDAETFMEFDDLVPEHVMLSVALGQDNLGHLMSEGK